MWIEESTRGHSKKCGREYTAENERKSSFSGDKTASENEDGRLKCRR